MENKKPQEQASKNLEWGEHNPKLTDENFIDRNQRKAGSDEIITGSNTPGDLNEDEPGRNRKGVKEGKHPLDLEEKRGKAF